MNVEELGKKLNLELLTVYGQNREIEDVYIGDLLSVVMGKCREGSAWITVQTHMNILTVADLNEAACIIIAGNTAVDQSLIDRAEEFDICLFKSSKEAYELAWKIHEVLS